MATLPDIPGKLRNSPFAAELRENWLKQKQTASNALKKARESKGGAAIETSVGSVVGGVAWGVLDAAYPTIAGFDAGIAGGIILAGAGVWMGQRAVLGAGVGMLTIEAGLRTRDATVKWMADRAAAAGNPTT